MSVNPIFVVVHRKLGKDAERVFKETLERLYIPGIDISYDTRRKMIDIGKAMTIQFRAGDVGMMAGLRCDFFNADTGEAIEYLYTRGKNGWYSRILDWDRYVSDIVGVLKEENKNE